MSLPTGIVAFLMTDVASSSGHWRDSHARMESMLDELAHMIEAVVVRHRGHVIVSRGEGDSHFAAFARASDAVLAARDVVATQLPLRIRAAVHAGELDERNGDYVGLPVNHAARLRGCAHPGQVLVSQTAADLAAPRLPDGVSLTNLGPVSVRDWDTQEIFQLRAPGLDEQFPPPNVGADARIMCVVVTDVRGASELTGRMTDAQLARWERGLASMCRSAFAHSGGRWLNTTGDGSVALFDDPEAAVSYAREVEAECARRGLRLAAAVDAGRVEFADGSPSGRVIYRTATLRRSTESGVAISTTVADMLPQAACAAQ